MQATYQDGTVGLWEDYNHESMTTMLDDPEVRHVKVRKMTAEEMAGRNKKIERRRAANKSARKAKRKSR